MHTQEINFPNNRSLCIIPHDLVDLQPALTELALMDRYSVIVLIGGYIQAEHAEVTKKAVRTIAKIASERESLVICGGTEVGVMSLIAQVRAEKQYPFPLLGITVASLVTWPGDPRVRRFSWWGKKRWRLSPHYSHFILTPGGEFGNESPWIVEAATLLSQGRRSVTVLANGGAVAQKDVELSLKANRPVVALAGTGCLADTLAGQTDQPKNVVSIPGEDEQRLTETIQSYL